MLGGSPFKTKENSPSIKLNAHNFLGLQCLNFINIGLIWPHITLPDAALLNWGFLDPPNLLNPNL